MSYQACNSACWLAGLPVVPGVWVLIVYNIMPLVPLGRDTGSKVVGWWALDWATTRCRPQVLLVSQVSGYLLLLLRYGRFPSFEYNNVRGQNGERVSFRRSLLLSWVGRGGVRECSVIAQQKLAIIVCHGCLSD